MGEPLLTHQRLECLESSYRRLVEEHLRAQHLFDTPSTYYEVKLPFVTPRRPPGVEELEEQCVHLTIGRRLAGTKRREMQDRIEGELCRRYPLRWISMAREWFAAAWQELINLRVGAYLQAQYDSGRRAFPGADLRGADLSHWDGGRRSQDRLVNCFDVEEVDLREADLRGASFYDATVGRADLRGADLRDTDLRGTDFSDSDLRGADLRGARVGWDEGGRCTNLTGTRLEFAELAGARMGSNMSEEMVARLGIREVMDRYVCPSWGFSSGLHVASGERDWREC